MYIYKYMNNYNLSTNKNIKDKISNNEISIILSNVKYNSILEYLQDGRAINLLTNKIINQNISYIYIIYFKNKHLLFLTLKECSKYMNKDAKYLSKRLDKLQNDNNYENGNINYIFVNNYKLGRININNICIYIIIIKY